MANIPQRITLSALPAGLLIAALATILSSRAIAQPTGTRIPAEYTAMCASCHGANGRASGRGVRDRADFPSHSLADCAWMEMMSDATLFIAIKAGGPSIGVSAAMPAYAGRLSDDQITRIVAYIRGLCPRRASRSKRSSPPPLTTAEARRQ